MFSPPSANTYNSGNGIRPNEPAMSEMILGSLSLRIGQERRFVSPIEQADGDFMDNRPSDAL